MGETTRAVETMLRRLLTACEGTNIVDPRVIAEGHDVLRALLAAPTSLPADAGRGEREATEIENFQRTLRGQELLDRAQEVRAIKRLKDPVWLVLQAAETMDAAASVLDGPEPLLARKVRGAIHYLLDVVAHAGELSTENVKRDILASLALPSQEEPSAVAFLGAASDPYVWQHPNPGFGYEVRVVELCEAGYRTLAQGVPSRRLAERFALAASPAPTPSSVPGESEGRADLATPSEPRGQAPNDDEREALAAELNGVRLRIDDEELSTTYLDDVMLRAVKALREPRGQEAGERIGWVCVETLTNSQGVVIRRSLVGGHFQPADTSPPSDWVTPNGTRYTYTLEPVGGIPQEKA